MNKFRVIIFAASLVATAFANQGSNSLSNNLQPRDWLTPSQLEQLPSVDQITYQQLEKMTPLEGAELVNQIYNLANINYNLRPTYRPQPSEIPAYIVNSNGQKINVKLDQLVATAKQQPHFGEQEVTVLITGLPNENQSAQKATRKLVQAYMQRYNQRQNWQDEQNTDVNMVQSSSEENSRANTKQQNQQQTGYLVVIELGQTLQNFHNTFMLDFQKVGTDLAEIIAQFTNDVNVPREAVHLVAQGMGAHVAGVAGRKYTSLTGHQLRRITALDPSRIAAKYPNTLNGLARGDAEFVDAIHTSAYGLGTDDRVGNVDFYPNGPNVAVPGAENIIEASMRATRYFAESVRPGSERNFPAVAASNMQEYESNNGYGPRTYMGIDTDYDLEGDYILKVNSKSPFGRQTPAQVQNGFNIARQHQHQ